MNVIEMTRELGKLIQQDDRYVAYNLAVTANDDDAELQNIIGEFNLKRLALNEELGKADKNTDYVKINIADYKNRLDIPKTYQMNDITKRVLKPIINEFFQFLIILISIKLKQKKDVKLNG